MNHASFFPQKKKIVVVGNGMVGHKFLEKIIQKDTQTQFDIRCFCEEPRTAYDRVKLSAFFSDKTATELQLASLETYQEWGIGFHLNDKVAHIDREKKEVLSEAGVRVTYDALILATGSYPFMPPIEGNNRPHVFVYRTIEDLIQIKESALCEGSRIGVVVGGGLLGLEAAKALKDLGLETHVVEFAPRLMAVQVDDLGGNVLRKKIESLGVKIHTQKNTLKIEDDENHRHKMVFADGSSLSADIILFSAGIRPRDDIAKNCGLEIGKRGGIVINNYCQTSDPSIYAIGECALWNEKIFGLVAPGFSMAEVAVEHLHEGKNEFLGADMSTKLKLLGVDVASIGDAHGVTPESKSYTIIDEAKGIYKKVVVDKNGENLLGAILIGDAANYGSLLQLALNKMLIPKQPLQLILPDDLQGGAGNKLGVDNLPDSAQICSCNNVSKAELCSKISAGVTELSELKSCTKAATSCGGCAALVKQILDRELEKQGLEVKKDICEHFAYSRQQLYHLAQLEQIKTFEDLISKHGKGKGCDICKPATASILASLWNEHVLSKAHAGIQDTNDYFLANLQKDGSYSVVPRIPGGEITPEKLIAIGVVAQKYNLYTKITGGQRIDLFGARVEQLPPIWKELIEAGFESGHAYGKALRTVKSCVGDSWCRYGVQDSVGLAIEIENRYRGLRSPHKLKMAVSGCTRECAEAQSKDVGIIATEKGWNLYVCGNGGMKPRHADLLASDLDKQTLIRYIDRFFMFYIKTADRLQRTSVWLDNLEGGLNYLKEVICNDSLHLGEALEAQMAHIVATYECEWKAAIENPEKLKRFKHFVNSNQTDSNIVFVKERGQIRPAKSHEKMNVLSVI